MVAQVIKFRIEFKRVQRTSKRIWNKKNFFCNHFIKFVFWWISETITEELRIV